MIAAAESRALPSLHHRCNVTVRILDYRNRGSLAQPDGQLTLWLRHLAPEFPQVSLHRSVVGLFAQGQSEPAIGRRKIARRAQSRGIERAHLDHGFRVSMIGCWLQQVQAPLAVLAHSFSVDIFLRLADRVGSSRRAGLRRDFLGHWSGLGRSRSRSCSRRCV